jgi:hypothetical protein
MRKDLDIDPGFVHLAQPQLPHVEQSLLDSGWPIRGAARSITVAADTCTEAGMLATLAMLKGPQAELFLRQQGLQYWVFR